MTVADILDDLNVSTEIDEEVAADRLYEHVQRALAEGQSREDLTALLKNAYDPLRGYGQRPGWRIVGQVLADFDGSYALPNPA